MGKSQRIKGRAFEQKIARILKYIWPESRRGIQYRDGGKEASDIMGTPYHIECSKGGESIWAKWKQANEDAFNSVVFTARQSGIQHGPREMKPRIVIKQRDREEPVVMMSLKSWLYLEILREWLHREFPDLMQTATWDQYKKEFGKL
jgi:hypothetical protein